MVNEKFLLTKDLLEIILDPVITIFELQASLSELKILLRFAGDSTNTSVYQTESLNPDGISNSGDEYYKYEWTGAGGTICINEPPKIPVEIIQ